MDELLKVEGLTKTFEKKSVFSSEKTIVKAADDITFTDESPNILLSSSYDRINEEQKNLSLQLILQSEVIEWYVKVLYNRISSPHQAIPFNDLDKQFIIKEARIEKTRKKKDNRF